VAETRDPIVQQAMQIVLVVHMLTEGGWSFYQIAWLLDMSLDDLEDLYTGAYMTVKLAQKGEM
jgi:hypothetical protein